MTANAELARAVDQIVLGWLNALGESDLTSLRARAYDRVLVAVAGHSDPTADTAVNAGHAAAYLAELSDVSRLFLEHTPTDPWTWRTAMTNLFNITPTGWAATALAQLYRLADRALIWWPNPARQGDNVAGVTVGARTNTVDLCALCDEPVPSGRDQAGQMLLRRIDGNPLHAAGKGCYWVVWRQRRTNA